MIVKYMQSDLQKTATAAADNNGTCNSANKRSQAQGNHPMTSAT